MLKEWDDIQAEVTRRVRVEFERKYKGNKTQFAKAAGCDEKTIRKLFDEQMNMKLELLFKLCIALEMKPSEILKDLSF